MKEHVSVSRRVLASILSACVMVLVLAPVAWAKSNNPNPGIAPVNSHPYGKSYGEWQATWVQWLLSYPVETNPLLFPNGEVANFSSYQASSSVWLMPNNPGGWGDWSLSVPSGTGLFFVVTGIFGNSATGDGDTMEELLAYVNGFMSTYTEVAATIDGTPVQMLDAYKVTTGLFSITVPEDNLFTIWGFDVPAGTSYPNLGGAYCLMLNPLPPGDHTVHFTCSSTTGFWEDNTYRIHVEPGKGNFANAPLPATGTTWGGIKALFKK